MIMARECLQLGSLGFEICDMNEAMSLYGLPMSLLEYELDSPCALISEIKRRSQLLKNILVKPGVH
jgi:hypothetical protein